MSLAFLFILHQGKRTEKPDINPNNSLWKVIPDKDEH